ncbi:ATP-dependent DNA helicase RecG [Sulfobacillus harzensis]|uniref:ATP-dependent DNA helicase RecG n=1 Tax=Sulfobacillus harzensis TaxID=2729629 RepID=A0A7Y0Q3Q1_9FIRM|nr:ATP-dependent DNA helicase RecG [Sulfobacillus harzensis]NMP22414.1 ATP-dependent DNA helicase RecG [Sulfobacillus harzensis]
MAGGTGRRTSSGSPVKPLDGDRLAALALGDSIGRVPGVGPKRAQDLAKLGVDTVQDLATLWPRRHLDRTTLTPIRDLQSGTVATIRGRVEALNERFTGRGQSVLKVRIGDSSGHVEATFFHARWIKRQLAPGTEVMLSGRIESFRGRPTMTHPDLDVLSSGETPRLGLVPVYPLAGDLKQRFMQDLLSRVIPHLVYKMADPLPESLKAEEHLADRAWAILHQHFPETLEDLERSRRRLVFDEFLRMSLAVLWLHRADGQHYAPKLNPDNPLLRRFLEALPFDLTDGQKDAWRDIRRDLGASKPMARLLQGDVGSGKTMLAALSMLTAVGSGYQAAMMAPTELLAEQHALSLEKLMEPLGIPVLLVTGRPGREREVTYSRLASDEPLIAIGTQALVSERVSFGRLGVVVVDEQHRFGVRQRADLSQKGLFPHMLVMTATPIPRTLALTVYGDLEVSQIRGLPPGRQPIQTVHVPMKERRAAYQKVLEAVKGGRQAYVICPLVEESEESQGRAATLLAEGMQKLPGWRVGLIHGRMSAQEKSTVMEAFREHRLDVLVGTTILEVGVDVPNATVVVIEGADRFGLAQLHQLRGRVGRGSHASACYLLADPATAEGEARIQAMTETQDGLILAERDLEIRGPGEVLGMRQHGVAGFQLANPLKDLALLERARERARHILTADPGLTHPDHAGLKNWVFEALEAALPSHVLH